MNRDPFSAIADPTRREIIGLLAEQSLSISEVAGHFPSVSRQAVTKHLNYLEACGLLRLDKAGREKYCYLQLERLAEVNEWLRQYERFWQRKLDRLGTYLDAPGAAGPRLDAENSEE